MRTSHIVTSPVHGDHAAYADFSTACQQVNRLNSKLFDSVVHFPLIELDFEISRADESALGISKPADSFLKEHIAIFRSRSEY